MQKIIVHLDFSMKFGFVVILILKSRSAVSPSCQNEDEDYADGDFGVKGLPNIERDRYHEDLSSVWSKFSCCRSIVNLRIRERRVDGILQLDARQCNRNYCTTCSDQVKICDALLSAKGNCTTEKRFLNFMVRFCPETCGWCYAVEDKLYGPPVFAYRDTHEQDLRLIRVLFNACIVGQNMVYDYKFVKSFGYKNYNQYPWVSVKQSVHLGEVQLFYLYRRPVGPFTAPIFFCVSVSDYCREIWTVSKHGCLMAGGVAMLFYGSFHSQPKSEKLYIANRDEPPISSRVFRYKACCGYTKFAWHFFAPIPNYAALNLE